MCLRRPAKKRLLAGCLRTADQEETVRPLNLCVRPEARDSRLGLPRFWGSDSVLPGKAVETRYYKQHLIRSKVGISTL